MQPFQIQEFEPVSDYIRKIFKAYREIKVKVLTHLQNASKQRAALTNRFRRQKTIRVGDRVLLRDQRQQRAGGRTPYKQPLTDPVTVKKISGNKAIVTHDDGRETENVHLEDMLLHVDGTKNLESETREPIEFPEDDEYDLIDSLDVHRTPGEMIEDDGALRDAHRGTGKSFKLDKAVAGSIIAYSVDKHSYGIGMVLNVSRVEGKYVLHRYGPASDGRLGIRWHPLYYAEDGSED